MTNPVNPTPWAYPITPDPTNRIKAIQTKFKIAPDGLLGNQFLTAVEKSLGIVSPVTPTPVPKPIPVTPTDNTVELQQRLSALKPGDVLDLSGRSWQHSSVLRVTTPRVKIDGKGTGVMVATNELASSFQVLADDVTVTGLSLTTPHTTSRTASWESYRLLVKDCARTLIENVTINGGAAAGLFISGASNYVVRKVKVYNTLADAIHNTGGSTQGLFDNCLASGCGDDGLAVVSYLGDGKICSDITSHGFTLQGQTHGRGISVVGGLRIRHYDINVDRSSAAAVYLAAEPASSYNTYAAQDVQIIGGTITNANQGIEDHGGIFVWASRPDERVTDIVASGVTITNTRGGPSKDRRIVGFYYDRVNLNA